MTSARLSRAAGEPDDPGAAVRLPVSEIALSRAARLCRAVGDPARIRLLLLLSGGEMCVTEIASVEGETLSTISQRLRVLRSENLVVSRRKGKHVNYAVADRHVRDFVYSALAHATEGSSSDDG